MTLFAAACSGRHVPANTSDSFNRRLFRLHNPARREPPRKAVDVFPRTITHIKIQGFPASQPPKNTFSAGGKSPENPVFKPFFRRLLVFFILHQYHALNVARAAWIDVLGLFFEPYVYGNMSMGFQLFLENPRFKKINRPTITPVFYILNIV